MPPKIKNNRFSEPTDLSGIISRGINPPPIADISVARLIDDCLIIFYREVKNLLALSVSGKLQPNDARDLRDHLKLLFELKAKEDESLKGLTDEELKEQATKALAPEVTDETE